MSDNGFWRGRKVLITGHTGFKGGWAAYWLSRLGADVSGIALPPPTAPNLFEALRLGELVDHHVADIRDLDRFRRLVSEIQPSVVMHMAAQSLVRRSYVQPLETWQTNVMGSLHVMEALRALARPCIAIMVTTDKVYRNQEWLHPYRESDPLGGHDPYSASKAAMELAVNAWRQSFVGKSGYPALAAVRAGNIIGGGDWAEDRLVPDCVRAVLGNDALCLRNPLARRPWQHVLEPISGYMRLVERIAGAQEAGDLALAQQLCGEFNFGPDMRSNRTVAEVAAEVSAHWPLRVEIVRRADQPHESSELNLAVEKAYRLLDWAPRLTFKAAIARTIGWYRAFHQAGADARALCDEDIALFQS